VASPELDSLRGEDEEIEELKAELLVRWNGARPGGERTRARRSSQWREHYHRCCVRQVRVERAK
jgi:hypothetical protein